MLGIIEEHNKYDGPKIVRDGIRGWGLQADRFYRKGEVITEYGGKRYARPICGDYVAKIASDCYVDAEHEFKPWEKGRWINESSSQREYVNVKLGRQVRALCDINKGDMLYADYGNEYERTY